MRRCWSGCLLMPLVWLAGSIWADEAARLPGAELLAKSGHEYARARDALLEAPEVVDIALGRRVLPAYSEETWLPLALTESLAMHLTHADDARRLRNLEGLQPEHYLQRRRPEPSATLELALMKPAVPLMIELFVKEIDIYPWSSAGAAATERRALQRDLLFAVGRSGHPASLYFLSDLIEGGCGCCETCEFAVSALGETGRLQALPLLAKELEKARAAGDVARRALAVEALGGIRHPETWPYIASELASAEPAVRESAALSAGAYASRWHWQADPAQGAAIRSAVGASLLAAIAATEDEGVVRVALESIGAVATGELRLELEARLFEMGSRAQAPDSGGPAKDRMRRALDRVNGSLARRYEEHDR